MVELAGDDSPFKNSVDNTVLIIAAVVVGLVFCYFGYKLVSNIRDKQKTREEKKLAKQQKKEKEAAKKNAPSPKKTK